MAENVVLEEEYDPDYVPTKAEIQEYAEFLGMDLTKKDDTDLLWIAEEGLKAPLPSDWKPCKTDDKDIYYFNFETGESRWEHPCDEYYKELYKAEKIKQIEKQKQKQNRLFAPTNDSNKAKNITDNFDSLFQNEIEGILESDIVSSEHSLSPIKTEKKKTKTKQSAPLNPIHQSNAKSTSKPSNAAVKSQRENPEVVADKLQAELDKLVSKTDSSSIPTFHMDLSRDLSRKQSRDKLDEEYYREKQLYLESLESELRKFKEDSKREKMSKMEEKMEDEIQTFEVELEEKMKKEKAAIIKKHNEKIKEFQQSLETQMKTKEGIEAKHQQIVDDLKKEHGSKLKEMNIAYNRLKNEVLTMQKDEIQKLKEEHEKSVEDMKKAMSSDVDSLTERRHSIQKQNDSLESFKLKKAEMERDHGSKLDELKEGHEKRLVEAQSKWNEEFETAKQESEQRLSDFLKMMESKKMDHLSDQETSDFKDKYAADIQSRKEKIKAAMHQEHEEWKEQKKRYYAQCRGKETEKYEEELKSLTDELQQNMSVNRADQEKEIATLDRMHELKVTEMKEKFEEELEALVEENELKLNQIKEDTTRKCAELEQEMMEREQSKRDELRKQYKEKYDELMNQLQSQNKDLDQNLKNNIHSDKLMMLKAENQRLRSDLDEIKAELKEEKILFSTEKRELIFQSDGLRQKLLNYDTQERQRRERMEAETEQETVTSVVEDEQETLDHVVEDKVMEEQDSRHDAHDQFRRHGHGDQRSNMNEEVDQQSIYSTFDHSEFVSLRHMDLNESNELPSTVSKWSEYLQKERESIDTLRVEIASRKKVMRQKQRRLEESQSQWKKDRDKLKMMTMNSNFVDHKQFHSIKSMLKKKKYDLDEHVYDINEQILEIRESSELLKKRESRLQRLEIEYIRTQGANQREEMNVGQSLLNSKHNPTSTMLNTQQSIQSIPLIAHPPSHRDASLESHQSNIYDYQSTQQHPNAVDSQQRVVIRSNSVGQEAIGSVISKYVKHKKHALEAIGHHKSWLKSFRSEIRNVSNSINPERPMEGTPDKGTRERRLRRHHRYRRYNGEERTSSNNADQSGKSAGEVVIRVKIEK